MGPRRGLGPGVTERQHTHIRRPSRIEASRVDAAAGAMRGLGCPVLAAEVQAGDALGRIIDQGVKGGGVRNCATCP